MGPKSDVEGFGRMGRADGRWRDGVELPTDEALSKSSCDRPAVMSASEGGSWDELGRPEA